MIPLKPSSDICGILFLPIVSFIIPLFKFTNDINCYPSHPCSQPVELEVVSDIICPIFYTGFDRKDIIKRIILWCGTIALNIFLQCRIWHDLNDFFLQI